MKKVIVRPLAVGFLKWIGIGFFCFTLFLSTSVVNSLPVSAAAASNHSTSTVAKPMTVDTRERCSGALSGGWSFISAGPSECGYQSWNVTTPTSATADYHMGSVSYLQTYGPSFQLWVYATNWATAYLNYDVYIGGGLRKACTFNSNVDWGWYEVCSFTLNAGDTFQDLTIHQWTGQRTPGLIMSHSAIQLTSGGVA